jgi:hypothetical protein
MMFGLEWRAPIDGSTKRPHGGIREGMSTSEIMPVIVILKVDPALLQMAKTLEVILFEYPHRPKSVHKVGLASNDSIPQAM